jgi:hypothetical protein
MAKLRQREWSPEAWWQAAGVVVLVMVLAGVAVWWSDRGPDRTYHAPPEAAYPDAQRPLPGVDKASKLYAPAESQVERWEPGTQNVYVTSYYAPDQNGRTCHYVQVEGVWYTDFCIHRPTQRPTVLRVTQAADPRAVIIDFDTGDPNYVTVRDPNNPLFQDVGWVRQQIGGGPIYYSVYDYNAEQWVWVSQEQYNAAVQAQNTGGGDSTTWQMGAIAMPPDDPNLTTILNTVGNLDNVIAGVWTAPTCAGSPNGCR